MHLTLLAVSLVYKYSIWSIKKEFPIEFVHHPCMEISDSNHRPKAKTHQRPITETKTETKNRENDTMTSCQRRKSFPFLLLPERILLITAVLSCLSCIATSLAPTPVANLAARPLGPRWGFTRSSIFSTVGPSSVHDGDEQDDFWSEDDLEVLTGDGSDFEDEYMLEDSDEDWVPDIERAQRRRPHQRQGPIPANEVIQEVDETIEEEKKGTGVANPPSTPYTEDEEELIQAMGGSGIGSRSSGLREEGFLGDCTLAEIASDYSVPICYLADVLCMWGVPVPIDVHDRLGDLVTGEQAFALVEAVNSLDIGVLQDRYSNQHILQLCEEWDIELAEAFNFAMKEGWSLPFGVRTNLRVEQEEELLRVFSRLYQPE